MPEERKVDVDVVVIGAGLAGLAAALRLTEAGATVAVIEARERVGGRTLNTSIGNGHMVEIGGQFAAPTDLRLLNLADELGVKRFKTHSEGASIFVRNKKSVRFDGEEPPLGEAAAAEARAIWDTLDELSKQIDVETPWTAPLANVWDRTTVSQWLDGKVVDPQAREYIDMVVESFWAIPAYQLSLLHVLFVIAAAGGYASLTGTSGGAHELRFEGGSQAVSLGAAARLGDRLILGQPVERITWYSDHVVAKSAGALITAKRAIIACAPPLAGRLKYDPPLPHARDQLTQRTHMGAEFKCQVVYDRPFWREAGLSGFGVSLDRPVVYSYDSTPPEGSPGVLLTFIGGDDAVAFGQLNASERRQRVIDGFVKFFGAGAATPLHYVETSWMEEPFSGGCFFANFPPGTWTSFGEALRQPVGALHWASCENATSWFGHMEGAVQSGEAVAREVLAALPTAVSGRT